MERINPETGEIVRSTYAQMGADGLEVYPDTYNGAEQDYDAAVELKEYILNLQRDIDQSFLRLGMSLCVMDDNKYYLALGLPSFKAFLDSDEITLSYRLGNDLMRIVRELVPILQPEGTETLPSLSVSSMRELLPLIGTDKSPEEIVAIADEIENMTVRDAREHIKESRGLTSESPPVIFVARVQQGEAYHRVTITRTGGEDADVYQVTPQPLMIKPADWARWQQRFSGFIRYE